MALFPGDMNIGWGFGRYPEPEKEDDMSFDLEEKEGVLSRLDSGNRTITLDEQWLFHCSPSLFGAAARYLAGTTLLIEYRLDHRGLRQVKSIVLKKRVEAAG